MSLLQLRNVHFGRSRANVTGSAGVGYALLDTTGTTSAPRTTVGVYQLVSGSGAYAAYISFPDNFRGQVLWDCPPVTTSGGLVLSQSYATEQYNYEENNPNVDSISQTIQLMSGTLSQLYRMNFGRWLITGNQMIFYADDNSTEVARFNLYDDLGAPTMDAVFDRRKA